MFRHLLAPLTFRSYYEGMSTETVLHLAQPEPEAKPKPKRRTKAVIEAENEKLGAEVARLENLVQLEREARAPKHTLATTMTAVMSAVIPAFCTVFALVAGTCFEQGNHVLAVLGAIAVVLALTVSMPHLGHAIQLLTNSSERASWTLAIAFDMGVVLSEMARVMGPEEIRTVMTVTLFILMALSGVLNYIAFKAGGTVSEE